MNDRFEPNEQAYIEAGTAHASVEAANIELDAFSKKVHAARLEHHVAHFLIFTVVNVTQADGTVSPAIGFGGWGNEAIWETLAAMGLRLVREEHSARIADLAGLTAEE